MVLELSSTSLRELGVQWELNQPGAGSFFSEKAIDTTNNPLLIGNIAYPSLDNPAQLDITTSNIFREFNTRLRAPSRIRFRTSPFPTQCPHPRQPHGQYQRLRTNPHRQDPFPLQWELCLGGLCQLDSRYPTRSTTADQQRRFGSQHADQRIGQRPSPGADLEVTTGTATSSPRPPPFPSVRSRPTPGLPTVPRSSSGD